MNPDIDFNDINELHVVDGENWSDILRDASFGLPDKPERLKESRHAAWILAIHCALARIFAREADTRPFPKDRRELAALETEYGDLGQARTIHEGPDFALALVGGLPSLKAEDLTAAPPSETRPYLPAPPNVPAREIVRFRLDWAMRPKAEHVGLFAQVVPERFRAPEPGDSATITGNPETREVLYAGRNLDPKPSLDLYNHSPDGFAWGYPGSGPAQLALAILLEKTADKAFSLAAHQVFKSDFLVPADTRQPITLSIAEIGRWIDAWPTHPHNPSRASRK